MKYCIAWVCFFVLILLIRYHRTPVVLFFGDSITHYSAESFDKNGNTLSRVAVIEIINAGMDGTVASRCNNGNLDDWLSRSSYNYAVFAFGTNDAYWHVEPRLYGIQLQACANDAIKHHIIPILPHILWNANTHYSDIPLLNAQIDHIVADSHGTILAGPDWYAFFKTHKDLLTSQAANGDIHPTSQGYQAMESVYEAFFTQLAY